MLPVAAEQLVGALAGERHGDVLRGELRERDETRARRGRRAARRDARARSVERDRLAASKESSSSWWSAPSDVGDEPRVGELVASPASAKPTANVCTGRSIMLRHQRDDQARVEPAAEHRAERHVAHQPQPDGLLELREQPLAPLLDVAAALERRLRIAPVAPLLDTSPSSITSSAARARAS